MTSLAAYFTGLRDRLTQCRHEKRQAERPTAPAFSVFDYILPDENRLSHILADLLDPLGAHAQGAVFARLFFEHAGIDFGLKAEDFDQVRVRREATTTQLLASRRIDVTLEVGRFAVGIENKPWAGDQPDQLLDYDRHLRARYGAGHYALIYLPGKDQSPPSLTEADREQMERDGRLRILALGTAVACWLDACRRECAAEHVAVFLTDFAGYLRYSFGGAQMGDETEADAYVSHALAAPDNLEVALTFLSHAENIGAGIRDAVVGKFVSALASQVAAKLAAHGDWVVRLGEAGTDAGWVQVTKTDWPDHADADQGLRVVLTHDSGEPFQMYFQVRRGVFPDDAGHDPMAEQLVEKVRKACGRGRVSDYWWPGWYKYAETCRHWDDPAVVLTLSRQGEALDYFASQLVQLAVAVDAAVVGAERG